MEIIILLTGCIDPNGMLFTELQNVNERKRQYIDAINWYLKHTHYKIVFVENSNNDISNDFINEHNSPNLELLTFNGNDYDKTLGKGYGEAIIIDYGLRKSKLITHSSSAIIVKVTGRLICENIVELVERYHDNHCVYANISKDDWGGNVASSQFVIAPIQFWNNYFLPYKDIINDSCRIHFEHLLYNSIQKWMNNGMFHKEFWIMPKIVGISGTSGKTLIPSEKRNIKDKIMYILHRYFNYRGYFNPFYKGEKAY